MNPSSTGAIELSPRKRAMRAALLREEDVASFNSQSLTDVTTEILESSVGSVS
jgi:hypothetical protein